MVHWRSIWYCCQRTLRTIPRKKIKKEEASRKKDEVGTWIKEHTYKTGGSYKREKKMYKRRDFCFKCHASVLGKCTTSDASFSIQKHGSFCLQKQKCFIIRSLLLTQNLNVNSYLKLLLPGTVLLKWTPDFSNSSPYRRKQLKWVKKRERNKVTCGFHGTVWIVEFTIHF